MLGTFGGFVSFEGEEPVLEVWNMGTLNMTGFNCMIGLIAVCLCASRTVELMILVLTKHYLQFCFEHPELACWDRICISGCQQFLVQALYTNLLNFYMHLLEIWAKQGETLSSSLSEGEGGTQMCCCRLQQA